jgi:zinc protease
MTNKKINGSDSGILRHRLKNGAVLLIKEDHTTPVVSINFWVEAGSVDEKADERGMAHLIEHMIFKGTSKRGVGEISRQVEAAGGYLNAFTSFEHTCFYVVLPSSQVQKALEIEFDAYFHSTFDTKELEKEKEVVFEEMRMRQDDPWSWSWELLFKILYRKNPYHWPVIGDMKILKHVPREKLLKYYKAHYVPSNTVITIVGDISSQSIVQRVKKNFETVSKPNAPRRNFFDDPVPKRLQLHAELGDVQQIYLSLAFPTVALTHPDAAPIEILESILGEGAASRLNLAIREKSQAANEVGTEYFAGKYGGAFVFQALTDHHRVEKCVGEMMAEVQKIILFGVPEDELLKVKGKIKAAKLFEKQNMDGQAKTIGFWELQGGYDLEEKFLKELDAVTSGDIKRVARQYLKPHRASMIIYHPKSQKVNSSPSHWQSLLRKGMDSIHVEKKEKHPVNGKLQKFILKNGSKLLLKERKNLPLASIGVFLKGGFSEENKSHYGITALMTKCLLKGTLKKNHENYSHEVESLAAHIDISMEKDYWGLTLDVSKDNFNKAFDLMLETIVEPRFSSIEIAKERKQQISNIKRLKDDPSEYALIQSDVLTFAKTYYAHMPMGTIDTVSKIEAQDIQKWHRCHLSNDNMTWVAVGDFQAKDLKRFLDSKLPVFSNKKVIKPKIPQNGGLKADTFKLENDSQQANMVLGFRAPSFKSPEYFTFRVLNTILNGMGGRLFVELREKKSLAYSVFAAHDAGLLAGIYQIYIGCAPAKVSEAKNELLKVLKKISDNRISPEELERAKTYMIGLYQVGLQSNRSQVHSYARYELMGYGAPWVEKFPKIVRKITRDQVQKAAKKYFETDKKTWVVLSPKGK